MILMDTEGALNNETAIWYTNYDNLKSYLLLFKRLPSNNAVDSFERGLGVWFNETRADVETGLSKNDNEVCSLITLIFDFLSQLFRHIVPYDERFRILDDIIRKNRTLPSCSVSFIMMIRIIGVWAMTLVTIEKLKRSHPLLGVC